MMHIRYKLIAIGYLVVTLILVLNCRNKAKIEIGNSYVDKERISNQIAIDKAYGNVKSDTISCILEILQQQLCEAIAANNSVAINDSLILTEADRFDRETIAPDILNRVKGIFSNNRNAYLEYYVRPILTERLLQEKFCFDTVYQKEPYRLVNEVFSKVECNSPIVDSNVTIFFPNDKIASSYQMALNKSILEDKRSYYFAREIHGILTVYIVKKNDYTEWFEGEALKVPLRIYDSKLKERLLETTRENAFWQQLLRNQQL